MTGIVERASRGAEDRRGHRLVWMFVGVTLAGLAVLASAFFSYRGASTDEIRALDRRADDNAKVANQLADQVEQLGGKPVVQPPAQPGEPGATGAPGSNGVNGRDGKDGAPGRDGRPGQPGQPGSAGATGAPGTAGQNGTTPPCMAEETQCRGADGKDGQNGERGPQGPPGPTCPDGYTAASRTYDPTPLVPGDEETWWVCVADSEGSS